ncbi:MAG: hypothetical protein JWM28_3825 [Chitinophagaceae bacterium]|nr:hypothetical protein [Chitinophagaceae bacterium]
MNAPKRMASAKQKDYPEIEKTARVNFLPPVQINLGEKKFNGKGYDYKTLFSLHAFAKGYGRRRPAGRGGMLIHKKCPTKAGNI